MKNKKVIITIIGILAVWVTAGIIDFSRVNRLERPLFCICTESMDTVVLANILDLGIPLTLRETLCQTQKIRGLPHTKDTSSALRFAAVPLYNNKFLCAGICGRTGQHKG